MHSKNIKVDITSDNISIADASDIRELIKDIDIRDGIGEVIFINSLLKNWPKLKNCLYIYSGDTKYLVESVLCEGNCLESTENNTEKLLRIINHPRKSNPQKVKSIIMNVLTDIRNKEIPINATNAEEISNQKKTNLEPELV